MRSIVSGLLNGLGVALIVFSMAMVGAYAFADDPGTGEGPRCTPNGPSLCTNHGCPPSIPSCGKPMGVCTCY